jgi:hypothetical protein
MSAMRALVEKKVIESFKNGIEVGMKIIMKVNETITIPGTDLRTQLGIVGNFYTE